MLASVLPNVFFWLVYQHRRKLSPRNFIRYVYCAEGLKFMGMAGLCVLFLLWGPLELKYFMASFVFFEAARLSCHFYILGKGR